MLDQPFIINHLMVVMAMAVVDTEADTKPRDTKNTIIF